MIFPSGSCLGRQLADRSAQTNSFDGNIIEGDNFQNHCGNEEAKSEESQEKSQEVILTSAQVRLQQTLEGVQVQTDPYTEQ